LYGHRTDGKVHRQPVPSQIFSDRFAPVGWLDDGKAMSFIWLPR